MSTAPSPTKQSKQQTNWSLDGEWNLMSYDVSSTRYIGGSTQWCFRCAHWMSWEVLVTFGDHNNPHEKLFVFYLFRFLSPGTPLCGPGNFDPEVKNHSPILGLWDYLILLSKSEDFLGPEQGLAVVSASNIVLRKDASCFEQMVLLGMVSSPSFHQVLLRNSFSLAFPYQ